MLHINIVGVVTCSDNSTRRLVTCIIGSFFSIHFVITLHSSIAATPASQYKKNKLKFNKMLSIVVDNAAANEQLTVNITSIFLQCCYGIGKNNSREIFVMSFNFMSCIFMPCNLVRHFMSCNFMLCNFDGPPFHFYVRHFQRPPKKKPPKNHQQTQIGKLAY